MKQLVEGSRVLVTYSAKRYKATVKGWAKNGLLKVHPDNAGPTKTILVSSANVKQLS